MFNYLANKDKLNRTSKALENDACVLSAIARSNPDNKAVETLLCGEYYEQKLEDKSEMDNLSVCADEIIKAGAERLDCPIMGE